MSAGLINNKDLWDSVCRTDPNAVKPITGKQYKGNSPKPYWIIEKATEKFGPCGSGWGVVINNEYFERLTDTDVLHVANVTVWYMLDDKRCELQQMGQTKAVYKTSTGTMLVDEDAPKKSVTDAMVKCLSMIGFAGDIFSGRWDDSKYVSEVAAEYAKEKQQETKKAVMDEKMFNGYFEKWRSDIKDKGRTAKHIIDTFSQKFELTDDQLSRIVILESSIKQQDQNNEDV